MDRKLVALALTAACCSTLALGLVVGVLLARNVARNVARDVARPEGAPFPAPFARRGPPPDGPPLELLERTLDLSPQQSDRIATIIGASRREMRNTRDSLRVRIDRELTPAQRERWRDWTHRAPRPGPPPREGPMGGPPPGPPESGEPR